MRLYWGVLAQETEQACSVRTGGLLPDLIYLVTTGNTCMNGVFRIAMRRMIQNDTEFV